MTEPKHTLATLESVSYERMDAISELVRRVSHDYNNLFGIVIAALGILNDDMDDHPGIAQLKPLISDALSASKEGTELMDQLLACTGYQLLQPARVDLAAALDELKLRLERAMPEDIALVVETEPGLPGAYVDRAALESAVLGLVDNAREAMPEGGTLRITAARYTPEGGGAQTGPLSRGQFLSIAVSDSGAGIDPPLLRKVVEPFVTTKEPARSRGFGLSKSYGFARQSNGWLFLESAPARGTRVTLVLPAMDREPA